jgi:DNA-binding MarR family transcriptional regulator
MSSDESRPTDRAHRAEPADRADRADPADRSDLIRLDRAMIRIWRDSKQRTTRSNSPLEGAGFALLGCLELMAPARLSDLAGMLRLDASTVSRQVRSLEQAGLITREPDPNDRRATRLLPTELGREELLHQRRERHAVLATAMRSWTTTERDTLVTLIERLAADVETSAASRASPPGSALTPAGGTPAMAST